MPSTRLTAFASTDVGRTRDHNEDVVAISMAGPAAAPYHVWLVADGMGGGVKGEVASATARDRALATLARAKDWRDPALVLADAVREANSAVYSRGTANGELSRSAMGTTLVLALAEPASGRYWVANVGDSRAYTWADRQLRQLTRDHSLVAEQVAAGILSAEEARLPEAPRNVITRAIGTDSAVQADVFGPATLAPGDQLVLCSDGLHGLVDDVEIAAILSEHPLAEAPGALIAAANAAGGSDNISVLVAGWAAAAPATATELPPVIHVDSERVRPWRRYAFVALGLLAAAAVVAALALMLSGGSSGDDDANSTPTAQRSGEATTPVAGAGSARPGASGGQGR